MTTTRSSAHYAGLLPVDPSDEPPPLRPTTLEDRFLSGQPSLRKRAPRALSRFLIPFCTGVAATLAWWSYGESVRQMIASWYPQLGWLAPQAASVTQNAPNMITFAAPATPSFDQQLNAMSLDLTSVRQSIDRIAAGQEQITRSIDQIASTSAGREEMTRSIDQIAASIATGQEKMTRNSDQNATGIAQAPAATATGPTIESQAEGTSLQPTARLEIKPTEARPPRTLSETGKQLSAANEHDASCFPSASAVAQNHSGGWPTWTFRAPGHEGTICWYAAGRPRGSDHRPRAGDHRSEMMPFYSRKLGIGWGWGRGLEIPDQRWRGSGE
jgi:hypothetical protein